MTALLTAQRLRDLLNYDSETGGFTWRVSRGGNAPAGGIAGSTLANGYRSIAIEGKRYLAHRLAWLYIHDRWPVAEIDHRDRRRAHNAIANLREATVSQNRGNSGQRRDNTSGFKGVSYHRATRKWRATIRVNGSIRSLGYYRTPEQAHAAYAASAAEVFGEFASA